MQAIGYDFDYDEYHNFVHGRLPYENLKPDPVLRTLLLGLPLRKIVSIILTIKLAPQKLLYTNNLSVFSCGTDLHQCRQGSCSQSS